MSRSRRGQRRHLGFSDFLYLIPHAAAAVQLQAGMKLKGRGSGTPMLDGHSLIQAEEVNGIKLDRKQPKQKAAHA